MTPSKKRIKKISDEEFVSHFQPIENHLNENAPYSYTGQKGCLFETYGWELLFVVGQNKSQIWTLIESEKDKTPILISGYHYINRIGYIITKVGVEKNQNYKVINN